MTILVCHTHLILIKENLSISCEAPRATGDRRISNIQKMKQTFHLIVDDIFDVNKEKKPEDGAHIQHSLYCGHASQVDTKSKLNGSKLHSLKL
jgi:hypothetical protein